MSRIRNLCAASVVLLVASTASFGESADQAVQNVIKGMGEGNAAAVWNAMPAGYQSDIAFLVHTGAAKMDPVVWNKSFAVAKKLVNVLKTKKDMILASPQMANSAQDPEKLDATYDSVVGMLSLLVNSEISDLDKLKTLDMGKFAAGTGSQLIKKAMALQEEIGQGHGQMDLGAIKDTKVTLTSEGDDGTAMLTIEAPDGTVKTEPFVQVEGKWVPQAVASVWTTKMAEAKVKVQTMVFKLDETQMAQFVSVIDMIETQLDGMAATEDQQQFNMQMMMTQMSLMGMAAQIQQQHMQPEPTQPEN